MKRKYIQITSCTIIVLLLIFTNMHKAVYSVITSYIIPVDDNYIIEKGEWVGDKYGVISLFDKSDSLANSIVYRDKKPVYKIKRLNKHFNEFIAVRIEDNQTDVFTYTGEFTK